jgi:hypothetical protein
MDQFRQKLWQKLFLLKIGWFLILLVEIKNKISGKSIKLWKILLVPVALIKLLTKNQIIWKLNLGQDLVNGEKSYFSSLRKRKEGQKYSSLF